MARCRRMMRRKCTCCCICKYIFLSIVAVVGMMGYKVYKVATCDTEESKNLITDLCHLYHTNQIAGSLCEGLCDGSKFEYEECGNYRAGKKVIFMQCRDCEPGHKTRVVLKTKDRVGRREKMELPKLPNGDLYPRWKEAMHDAFIHSVKFTFAIDLSHMEDIFSYIWGKNIEDYVKRTRDPNARMVAVQSVWSLLEQQEYTFYRLHSDKSFVPKLYGTCGPAYVTEFTPSVAKFESGVSNFLWTGSFRQRARVALEILKLLKVLEYDLHQPLHLCDVKGDNFGLRRNGEITLIDTDCASFQEPLVSIFFANVNCSSHEDCHFFDCHGYCDTSKRKCHDVRTNNNLQSVCEDVLIGGFSRFSAGLLRDPPLSIQLKLNKALHECAFPGLHNDKYVGRPASDESWDEIVSILKEYLNEQ